jgi:membrane-associated phospholipid phosphatase
LRFGLVGTAMWGLGPLAYLTAEPAPPTLPGTWRTWLLTSPKELRPAPPPSPSSAELAEVRDLQARRTAAEAATVAKWADGSAVLPWTSLALDLITTHRPSPVRAARALALLHIAVYDTVVATWDAKATFPRPAPSALDPAIVPLGSVDPSHPAFPSEHAAVAAAASVVLAYAFPDEPGAGLAALANEAAISRLWAGTNVRSDVEAGLAIGRAVGARAVAWGKADGSDAQWDGSGRPGGDGTWQPTPPGFVQEPLDPLAGTWRTWVVAGGDQFRPAPPASYGSPAWRAELAAVQEAVARRTSEQEAAVRFWAGGPGTATPAGIWTGIARDLVLRSGLDLPLTARVLTLTTVAMADAFVCCWDAKYAYWTARPITADPSLALLFPTPPFPSYTSGHATASAAAGTVLGHLFPDQAADLATRAVEASDSRLWAGIHFPIDCEMGMVGGGLVGRLIVLRAKSDDAEQVRDAPADRAGAPGPGRG